jgi:thymidylate kinase
MKPLLVVLNGPIGSGKTTVSVAVAGLAERTDHRAATIDVDEVWAMVDHQRPRRGGADVWSLARRGVAALADAFFADGVEVVIVNGPFYEPIERAQLLDHLATPADVRYVTLTVSFEEALKRTQADPDPRRDTSRQRNWLLKHHERAASLFEPLRGTDLIVDTDARTLDQVARRIAASLPLG